MITEYGLGLSVHLACLLGLDIELRFGQDYGGLVLSPGVWLVRPWGDRRLPAKPPDILLF